MHVFVSHSQVTEQTGKKTVKFWSIVILVLKKYIVYLIIDF